MGGWTSDSRWDLGFLICLCGLRFLPPANRQLGTGDHNAITIYAALPLQFRTLSKSRGGNARSVPPQGKVSDRAAEHGSCRTPASPTSSSRQRERAPGPDDRPKPYLGITVTSRPLKGDTPTIELVLGYKRSNESPVLKLLLSRLDELIARVSKQVH